MQKPYLDVQPRVHEAVSDLAVGSGLEHGRVEGNSSSHLAKYEEVSESRLRQLQVPEPHPIEAIQQSLDEPGGEPDVHLGEFSSETLFHLKVVLAELPGQPADVRLSRQQPP